MRSLKESIVEKLALAFLDRAYILKSNYKKHKMNTDIYI